MMAIERPQSTALVPSIRIGGAYDVGSFFWTEPDRCIGYASDAAHDHGLRGGFGGSMDIGDQIQVIGIEGDDAVVKAIKTPVPSGAACPHGMIFLLPVSVILSWPDTASVRQSKDKWRAGIMSKYGIAPSAKLEARHD